MAKAAWSSTSARLNRDSFLPFGSCYLCLEIARDPVSCSHGDIFCRECAVANLLAQKKEIKRLEMARKKAEQQVMEAQTREDVEAQERAIKEFEMIQAGINPSPTQTSGLSSSPQGESAALVDVNTSARHQRAKRKFVLDKEELERIAKEDRIKAKRSIENEKASKGALPSFWTPSQTPDADAARQAVGLPQNTKLTPICPASSESSQHSYSLKNFIHLNFKEEVDPKTAIGRRMCPSCLKTLGNASRPQLARKCGHVICRSCAVKLMAPDKSKGSFPQQNVCYVCDAVLMSDASSSRGKQQEQEFPGLIELRSEGTGFSARGSNKVEKSGGVAGFQC
ncbi:Nitric oxide synthase-interacting protein-like protein [Colletotrichum musicola]|uniref:Nitric oxide synthase-interacting protein-like protein n=1 Tax=Colletotrichum musicola TaxID=2175873 RepID=A0A8H6NW51_9PEZI|nr:Nitric oxide synthase-interacting protein-like protein [Colletotrichum musicola]